MFKNYEQRGREFKRLIHLSSAAIREPVAKREKKK